MKAHTIHTQKDITPQIALQYLKEGNTRFVENLKLNRNLLQQVNETTEGQWPFATILSCIDSRTSAELIFDQGLGDIFSVRIAGNFANRDILGSIEFACKVAGSKLLLVLGHNKCGALKGALDSEIIDETGMKNLSHLVHRFDKSIAEVITDGEEKSSSNVDLLERLTYQNIYDTIAEIRRESDTLNELEQNGEIAIVGGLYNVDTGLVEFLS